ncbi:MAG: hypothetical protein RLN76_13525 [Phycisphaeraceae bacterium]
MQPKVEKLCRQIKKDFTDIPVPDDWIWSQAVAPQIVDCVLSLRKKYDTVVEPRVRDLVQRHPDLITCRQLVELIESYPDPLAFHQQELQMKSARKGLTMLELARQLDEIQHDFEGGIEPERLRRWAEWAHPGDYLMLGVPGLGLAGFQYIRMLLGGQTVKPDVHVIRYVEQALGEKVADIQAVYLIEQAGKALDLPTKHLDVAIWVRGAW